MERIRIDFFNDGALSAYTSTIEHLNKNASEDLTVDAGSVGEMKIGPIVYIPGEVIVAGIGALSAALSAVLTYIATRKSGQVVLNGKNGRSIKIPKDVKKEDIDFYIEKAKELDVDRITLDNNDS